MTGLVYDDIFLRHDTGPGHPERSARLVAIVQRLVNDYVWDELRRLPVRPSAEDRVGLRRLLERVHAPAYLDRLEAVCQSGERSLDSDTTVSPESFEAAMTAAAGTVSAVDAVMSGGSRSGAGNAFCAVRPPGHHAERSRAMGFCLINNVAVAAERLIAHHGLERVAIVDFDVHHGNGTQHIFEDRDDVLFISIHEHPRNFYPGTGFAHERGTGRGEGFTLNIPMDPGSGDQAYQAAFVKMILPRLEQFAPQFLLVSAGFDACEHDPLAHMKVSPEGLAWMTRRLKETAERFCGGRLVSVLEGGYDLRSLAECVGAHVRVLMHDDGDGDELMAMKAGF